MVSGASISGSIGVDTYEELLGDMSNMSISRWSVCSTPMCTTPLYRSHSFSPAVDSDATKSQDGTSQGSPDPADSSWCRSSPRPSVRGIRNRPPPVLDDVEHASKRPRLAVPYGQSLFSDTAMSRTRIRQKTAVVVLAECMSYYGFL